MLVADPRRLVAARTDDLHVADVQRHRKVKDAGRLRARLGALMLLGHVDSGDDHPRPALGLLDPLDGALLAAILAGEHQHGVALAYVRHRYSTSGASDTIFM